MTDRDDLARAEAVRRWPAPDPLSLNTYGDDVMREQRRQAFIEGAGWAVRDAETLTDEPCRACGRTDYGCTPRWCAHSKAQIGGVRKSVENICDVCERAYPIWSTDDHLWNLESGERPGMECPVCFAAKWESYTGNAERWSWLPVDQNG